MGSLPDKQQKSGGETDYIRRYGVTPEEAGHDMLLQMIEDLLTEGLATEVEPFPETEREFAQILDLLRPLSRNQLRERLVLSGWLLKPHGDDQMRCQECMYYLVHRRWCDLPEPAGQIGLVVPPVADMTGGAMVSGEDDLRGQIGDMLSAGLKTEIWPRAGTSAQVIEITMRLRAEAGADLTRKLVVAGVSDHVIEAGDMQQSCATCMYYQVHRRFCELPELMVPVEPHWSCRLWRI